MNEDEFEQNKEFMQGEETLEEYNINFVKDFMKSCTKAQDMLNEMEKANENVHPL